VVSASCNHYFAEEFFLAGEVTVDRLHGNARGLGNPIHRRSREPVPQKVLMRSKHNRTILLGDHSRFGSVLNRWPHLCISPLFENKEKIIESTTIVSVSSKTSVVVSSLIIASTAAIKQEHR
jgi:hypothetical protein